MTDRTVSLDALADLPASGATSRWVSGEVGLHVLDYAGPADATTAPIVLVPGISMPAMGMDFVARELARTRRVLVTDVRGRGLSQSGDDYSMPAYAQDLERVITALVPAGDAVLVGHSMGARIVTLVAARGEVEHAGVVAIDPPISGPGRDPYPTTREAFMGQVEQALRGTTADEVAASWPTWPRREQEIRARWLGSCAPEAIGATHDGFESEDFFEWWPQVPAPVAFIQGADSPVVPTAAMDEVTTINPHASVHVVPAAGHMVFWDNAEGAAQVLSDALDAVGAD
ncbi:alpha/beta hydrolase [Janibacter sp. Soil728]|uniref:alpha/beta fold hydrolase n=1 Tax=Janibacter sp. Soil728 TaxID=1736393 RepID=UPI0006F690BB|nr:alpha/beta hydrolase [Janibacter sp. Soil728]KRE38929.1 alpha/beta hydrolase [Janibacter sp. Soil728]